MILARYASACVCYTEEIAERLRPYVPPARIFVARNTLDTDRLFALADALSEREKAHVRQELGLHPDLPCLLFLGRIAEDKGTTLLSFLMSEMLRRRPVQWLVVGEGPARKSLESMISAEGIPHVHFAGARHRIEESAPYLYASSMLAIPGRLGLAVNHGFAFGLPIVTQRSPGSMRYHGPEIAYVRHGSNGMLARFGSVESLADAVEHVLDHLDSFSESASQFARRELTVDRMVDGLVEAICYAAQSRQEREDAASNFRAT